MAAVMGNVTHSTFGNHRGPPSRRAREAYPTPTIAVVELHEVETIALSVLNPCGTPGDAISTVLTKRGHRVVCNDIAHGGVDFLTMTEAPRGVECAVMNAPFSLSADFTAHALDLCISKVCVLQRLGWLECGTSATRRKPETERRRVLFQRQQLERIWMFGTRLPRMHRLDWDGKEASATLNCAWFVFCADHHGKAETDWIWGDRA
jgi:hypothetical protein